MFRLISETTLKGEVDDTTQNERHVLMGYVWIPIMQDSHEIKDIYLLHNNSVVGTILLHTEDSVLVYVRPGASVHLLSETHGEKNSRTPFTEL